MTEKILFIANEPELFPDLERQIKNGLLKSRQPRRIHGDLPVAIPKVAVENEVEDNAVELLTFSDGHEALHWCGAQNPDMLIVDFSIPEMNNWQFIRRFREMPDKTDIPVLMLSEILAPEIRYQALEKGITDLVNKPVDPVELGLRIRNWLICRRGKKNLAVQTETPLVELDQMAGQFLQREQEMIFQLSKAVEYREMETGGHIMRIAYYAHCIAKAFGLPESDQYLILKTAPLHDIGKVGIPDRILRKTGNLNKEEYEIMKRHTAIGHQILRGSSSQLLQTAAEIALTHHERYNGSGYPQGLHGSEIPLFGRMVALADVFDALTTDKGYKKAWELDEAFEYIKEKSGKHFDPNCVEAFFSQKDNIIAIRGSYSDE
jgi:putative two-component system response regulator